MSVTVAMEDQWCKAVLFFAAFPLMFILPAIFMGSEERASWRSREPKEADLMTLLAGPPAYLLRGMRGAAEGDVTGAVISSFAMIPLFVLPAAIVPARPPRWFMRPWATHPPTGSRLKRMQRFEAAIQL